MLKTVSGGFLNYSFGWKPLIGDLQKLGHLSTTVSNRLKWLRDTRGKKIRLGFSQSFDVEGLTTRTLGALTLTQTANVGKFTAGGTLYHELDRLEGAEGQLRAFTAALGLNSPSQVAWERIPFSFVADWFARTKHISESLTVQPYPGTWQVDNVTHSFKMRTEYNVVGTGYGLVPLKNGQLGTLTCERYIRNPGLPASSSVLYGGEASPGVLALSAALLGAASR
jgi:hypothetical protein